MEVRYAGSAACDVKVRDVVSSPSFATGRADCDAKVRDAVSSASSATGSAACDAKVRDAARAVHRLPQVALIVMLRLEMQHEQSIVCHR